MATVLKIIIKKQLLKIVLKNSPQLFSWTKFYFGNITMKKVFLAYSLYRYHVITYNTKVPIEFSLLLIVYCFSEYSMKNSLKIPQNCLEQILKKLVSIKKLSICTKEPKTTLNYYFQTDPYLFNHPRKMSKSFFFFYYYYYF